MGTPAQIIAQEALQSRAQQFQQHEQQRIEHQNTAGALLLNSINTKLPPPDDPTYNDAVAKRENLLKQYVALNSPEQHAAFSDRLHGLIFGQNEKNHPSTQQAQQVIATPPGQPAPPMAKDALGMPYAVPNPAGQAAPPPQTPPPAPPAPQSAFGAPTPETQATLAKGQGFLAALKNHLAGFAHPTLPDPNANFPISDVATTYKSPAQAQADVWNAKEDERQQNRMDLLDERYKQMAALRKNVAAGTTVQKAAYNAEARGLGYTGFDDPTITPDDFEKIAGNVAQGKSTPSKAALATYLAAKYGPNPTADQIAEGTREHQQLMSGVKAGSHQQIVFDDFGVPHVVNLSSTSKTTFPGLPVSANAPQIPSSNPSFTTQSFQGKSVPGLIYPGNIDITNRPNIKNPDGSHSSTFSMSSEIDGKEVLYPGVGDGTTYPLRQLTEAEALDQYKKTGKNFGSFSDPDTATAYAQRLHEDQAKFGNNPGARPPGTKPSGGAVKSKPISSAAPLNFTKGNPIIKSDAAQYTKVAEDANGAQEGLNSLSTIYGPGSKQSPTASSDQQLIYAWVRANVQGAGRMTQAEFNAAASIGSLPLRAQTAWEKLKTGKLPPELEQELFADIQRGARSKANMSEDLRTRLQKPGAPVSTAAPTAPPLGWTPPAGAPPPVRPNQVLKDRQGNVVAKSVDGKNWIQP